MDKILKDMDDEDKPGFYSVFYNEEIYIINEKNADVAIEEPVINIVKEPLPQHVNISLHNNKKADLLLLFNYPAAENIPAEDEGLIKKALAAAKINFENDAAWLNTAGHAEMHWTDIETASGANKIIAFGINPKLLPALITEGEIYLHENKQVLNVASLAEMHENDGLKKALWRGMKAMFNL